MEGKLTGKQLKFAVEYVQCLNATEAARRAGYSGSDRALAVTGYENLRNPKIKAYIDETFAPDIMSAHEVLYHLTMIARGDIADVTDDRGNVDLDKAKGRGKSNLLKTTKTRTITTENSDIVEIEVGMYDRLTALGLLAKYHDLTNRMRVMTWEDEIIAAIRDGKVTYTALVNEFDDDATLVERWFKAAGVSIPATVQDE